jgi:lipopolysaccharide biosynthesis glycosyltransferase
MLHKCWGNQVANRSILLYDNNFSYAPAHTQFGHNISILHFIGQNKPWKYQRFADGRILPLGGSAWEGLKDMIQQWWNTWDKYYGRVCYYRIPFYLAIC